LSSYGIILSIEWYFLNEEREGRIVALADGPRAKTYKIKSRSISDVNKHYSDRQKIEAVTTYLMLGSLPLTAAALKMSEHTLIAWKRSEWWKDLVQEIKREENLVLSNKIKKIVDKSWDVVADRMEKGDFIYDQKTGKLKRKPVSMRDANKVAMDSVLLREKLNMNENFTVAADQIEDKLTKLAKAFGDLAKGIKPEEPVEDIEYVEVVNSEENTDAIHEEERPEGL
jgi:hypothetical protein